MTLRHIETFLTCISNRQKSDIMFQAKLHGATLSIPEKTVIDDSAIKALDSQMEKAIARKKLNGR